MPHAIEAVATENDVNAPGGDPLDGTMRAARFVGRCRVEISEAPMPQVGPGEILVEVDSCALCGSDRAGWTKGSSVTPGHETSGTVVAVGEGVLDPRPGARGVIFLVDACGACRSCRAGSPNRCLDKRAMYGFTAPGGLAEYIVVSARCFLPVADDVALDVATALLDLLGTTSHAFRSAERRHLGSVLVIGCGPIGLGAIVMARSMGATTVIALDIVRERLDLAARVGAFAIDASERGAAAAIRGAAPEGIDVVLEAAGRAQTQRQALDLVGAGGVVLVVAHSGEPLTLQASVDLIQREVSIVGCEYFRPDEFADNQERVRRGSIDPRPLLTHRFPLERAEEACETFFGGASGKVLVRP
jgi:threonine 3-dehydrogenase